MMNPLTMMNPQADLTMIRFIDLRVAQAVSKAWNLAKNTTRSAGSGTRSVAGRAAEALARREP